MNSSYRRPEDKQLLKSLPSAVFLKNSCPFSLSSPPPHLPCNFPTSFPVFTISRWIPPAAAHSKSSFSQTCKSGRTLARKARIWRIKLSSYPLMKDGVKLMGPFETSLWSSQLRLLPGVYSKEKKLSWGRNPEASSKFSPCV